MKNLKPLVFDSFLLLTALLFWTVQSISQETSKQAGNQKPIVVLAERVQGKVQFKVDSQPVEDLLLTLAKMESTRGLDYPVVAIADSRLPMDVLIGIDGVAGKAQLKVVRYFILNRDAQMMNEIKWEPAIPFSMHPPAGAVH